jgi:hypothetical protein
MTVMCTWFERGSVHVEVSCGFITRIPAAMHKALNEACYE